MYARATTTISVYRGQVEDDWGDVKDVATPVMTGVRASILEQKIYAVGEVTVNPHNYRWARLRVTKGTDVRQNDRIFDERLNQTWVIVNISPYQNPVKGQDLRIDLQHVG